MIPLVPPISNSYAFCNNSCKDGGQQWLKYKPVPTIFHLFMRLYTPYLRAIFASSLKQKIMKGTYINTVIMMAALSGKKSRRTVSEKETVKSLNDYKNIWSKNNNNNTSVAKKSKTALID